MVTFTCACCGREISGWADLAFDAPFHFHALDEETRRRSAELSTDFCVIEVEERDRFIRCVCPIPVIDSDEYFAWGIWVSLSAENFDRYVENFKDRDQSGLGGMFGWFCNRIPDYPDTLHLQTTIVPQDGGQRPMVWINDVHADHPLYRDQREGITPDRLGEIYAAQICQGPRASPPAQ